MRRPPLRGGVSVEVGIGSDRVLGTVQAELSGFVESLVGRLGHKRRTIDLATLVARK